MDDALATAIIDRVLGLQVGAAGQEAANRCSLEGLTVAATADEEFQVAAATLEVAALRLAAGPVALEIGRLALHQLAARVRIEHGRPRLRALEAARGELSGIKVHGFLTLARLPGRGAQPAGAAWCLEPLAGAAGTVRAEIVDAHLLFDADVTVPVRQGQVDFNEATVEHVGPDSRMGVSRLGIYVDAPNGRSYLYQFASAPVAGVEYERRGALLGPWVTDRGRLRLQAFAECLLRQGPDGHGPGLTEQARLLLDRTAVSGELHLADGKLAAPAAQVELAGRAGGGNVIRLHSPAVGRGLTLEMASLSARQALLAWRGMQARCGELSGTLMLRLFAEGGQLRFALHLANMQASGLRVEIR